MQHQVREDRFAKCYPEMDFRSPPLTGSSRIPSGSCTKREKAEAGYEGDLAGKRVLFSYLGWSSSLTEWGSTSPLMPNRDFAGDATSEGRTRPTLADEHTS